MTTFAVDVDTDVDGAFRVAERHARTTMRVASEDVRINVLSNSGDLDEVQRFLRPWYQLESGSFDEPDITVVSHVDGRIGSRDPITDIRVYLWASDDVRPVGAARVHRRPATAQIVISDVSRGRILLWSQDATESALALRLLVRDQLLRLLERRSGNVTFHGAAAESDGTGVAFIGARNAGKTTSLLELMASGRWNLVSADRTRLRADGGGIRMTGIPARCNIHQPAMEALPALAGILRRRGLLFDHDNKTLVDADELSAATGTVLVASAPLRLCVFPRIDPGHRGLRVTPVRGGDEATAALIPHVMEDSPNDKYLPWLQYVDGKPTPLEDRVDAILRCAAGRVPMVRVEGGFDDYVSALRTGALDVAALSREVAPPVRRH